MSGALRGEELTALINPVVTGAGFDLEDVIVSPAGRRSLVRVVVDSDDGVSLDDVAALGRAVASVLDEHEGQLGSAPYTLEVTSPGVDRPLMTHRHWRRAVGRLARIDLLDGPSITGRISAVDADMVHVEVDGAVRAVPFPAVRRGKVEVEFNRPAVDSASPKRDRRPGRPKKGRPADPASSASANDEPTPREVT